MKFTRRTRSTFAATGLAAALAFTGVACEGEAGGELEEGVNEVEEGVEGEEGGD